MTVVMDRSQKKINELIERHPGRQSQKVRLWERKLLVIFVGGEFDDFHSLFFLVVQGKLRFLLSFGFIISFVLFCIHTHIEILAVKFVLKPAFRKSQVCDSFNIQNRKNYAMFSIQCM